MLVGVDVSHSMSWTVEVDQKGVNRRRTEYVELGYLGHLVEILQGWLGAQVEIINELWSPETIMGLDCLLLPMAGREDDRQLSVEESTWLARFVDAGGGVLLFGDGDRAGIRLCVELTAATCALELGESFASIPRDGAQSHLLTYDVSARTVPGHPVTESIGMVHVHRARPILDPASVLTPLVRHEDQTLVAAAVCGTGRIAVVSNADMFTLPFLGRQDNAQFLLRLAEWVASGKVQAVSEKQAVEIVGAKSFRTRAFSPEEDLTQVCGPHLVDTLPYRAQLERLDSEPLPDPYDDSTTFLAEAELLYHEFPRSIRHAVSTFRHHSNDYGVLVLKGLPLTVRIPATPSAGERAARRNGRLGELWLAALSTAVGAPIAYRQEASGRLYQDVAPTPSNAAKLSAESSTSLLDFHTEVAFHPFMPDYVMLLCLRPDHQRVAKTISAGIRMILPRLALRDRAVLFEPLFRTGIDYSFGSPNGTKGNGPVMPVLYGDPFDPCLTLDLDLMVGLTPAANRALRNLQAAVNEVTRSVRLDTGDLLIVDNRRAVHGRSQFTPRYDGFDRWLQRMSVVRDPIASVSDRRGGVCVIETAFAV